MKTSEKAKFMDVLTGLAALGKVELCQHGNHVTAKVFTVKTWTDDEEPAYVGEASLLTEGIYAGEPLSAMGDAVISVVNKSFPALKFVSDTERARK